MLERALGPNTAIDYLENNHDAVPKGVAMDLLKAQLCFSAAQCRELDLIVRRMLSLLEANPENISDHPAVARCLAEMGQEQVALEILRRNCGVETACATHPQQSCRSRFHPLLHSRQRPSEAPPLAQPRAPLLCPLQLGGES